MQLGFKAVNPSSSYKAHEVNQIWNWIKTKSKPKSFFTSGKQWKAAAPPRRGKAAENWRKVKMEVLEAVNGGPLQFWNGKLLMLLIYNSSSSLHCICTLYIHGGVRTSHERENHCNSRKKYSRASRKNLIQIISVEYFQKLLKLDGTLIETAVSNSKGHFF